VRIQVLDNFAFDPVHRLPGDSLLVTTQRHIAKSTVFLLVGSPELLIVRKSGYDVFIAHRRRDASKYAQALCDKLTAEKICCVTDRVVYGRAHQTAVKREAKRPEAS
jgi:hypothetical protein